MQSLCSGKQGPLEDFSSMGAEAWGLGPSPSLPFLEPPSQAKIGLVLLGAVVAGAVVTGAVVAGAVVWRRKLSGRAGVGSEFFVPLGVSSPGRGVSCSCFIKREVPSPCMHLPSLRES